MTTIPGSENYQCKVVRIKEYKKHPDANKLFIVSVDNNRVITGVEPVVGSLHVYFPVLSKINESFLSYINAFDKPELNADKTTKGFFTSKCRVKPIKLRGMASEGYLHPLSDVENWIYSSGQQLEHPLQENDEFNAIGTLTVCEKYIVPSNKVNPNHKPGQSKHQESRLVDGQFVLHNDTQNLRKNIHAINPDSIIEISYKKHGTSMVVGNVQVKRNLKWHHKILQKIGIPVKTTEHDVIYSSRKVVKNDLNSHKKNHYYNTDIWGIASQEIKEKLPKGYTAYCEIIGFLPDGGYIQKGFDYGCAPGEHKVYVYKITQTNEDGFVINLTANQIKQFCEQYDLRFSDTLLYYGYAGDLYSDLDRNAPDWKEQFLDRLEKQYTEKDCYMCANKVPEEGIVVVVENMFEYTAYKLKSFNFLSYEDKQLENNESNLEDSQLN